MVPKQLLIRAERYKDEKSPKKKKPLTAEQHLLMIIELAQLIVSIISLLK